MRAYGQPSKFEEPVKRFVGQLYGKVAEGAGASFTPLHQSLKIRHNTMLGYYVEVPAKHAERLPSGPSAPFILRQSMVGAQRYATVELGDLETRHCPRRRADAHP